MKKFIAYFRVSTTRQGESGLGLEAQASSVRDYVMNQGTLVAEYTECESGKRSDRPQLDKALAHARRTGATLVIAKLDRLARNVHFLSTLMETGVDFLAVDNPSASRLTVQILAAVAEDELVRVSSRTKAALRAYKERGGKLGAQDPRCRRLSAEDARKGQEKGSRKTAENASQAYRDLVPTIEELRNAGKSYRQIAHKLNEEGHTTRQHRPWSATQVLRVLRRQKVPPFSMVGG